MSESDSENSKRRGKTPKKKKIRKNDKKKSNPNNRKCVGERGKEKKMRSKHCKLIQLGAIEIFAYLFVCLSVCLFILFVHFNWREHHRKDRAIEQSAVISCKI